MSAADQLLRLLRGDRLTSPLSIRINYRGDGHDQGRLDAAEAKRQRRRDRNIRHAYSMVVHR